MSKKEVHRINSITDFHRFRGLPKPEHPLISVIDFSKMKNPSGEKMSLVLDFYSIALKRNIGGKIRYGQQKYDFDEGIMFFIKPGQVYSVEFDENVPSNRSGYILQLHPDFLWNSTLAKKISQFELFGYSVNEALFLSDKEEATLLQIFENIQHEYQSNIDRFSQDLIITQLELLLKYADRFYHRQFITRKIAHHEILDKVEAILHDYFESGKLSQNGLPSPQYLADELNISRNYLNSVLKSLTDQTTQQHIHEKLIDKAKEILSTTSLSVSEIAYELGFEHSQSFSKLFKAKTSFSPLVFRQSFN